jgi:hypothetical protein
MKIKTKNACGWVEKAYHTLMTLHNTNYTDSRYFVLTGQRHFSALGDIVVWAGSHSRARLDEKIAKARVQGAYVHEFPTRAEAIETYPELA